MTGSDARSTRNGAYVCATGRKPDSASPAAAPTQDLLADADVEHPLRVRPQRFAQQPHRDVGELQQLRDGLTSCIGCGCLSLRRCALDNPGDRAAASGAVRGTCWGTHRSDVTSDDG